MGYDEQETPQTPAMGYDEQETPQTPAMGDDEQETPQTPMDSGAGGEGLNVKVHPKIVQNQEEKQNE
jgi:hypothetical protein